MYKNFTKLTDVLRGYSQQFMRVMRITAFLMLLCLLQLSAKTNAQLISLSGEKMPLMEVLKEIHRQSGVDFIFAASSLKHAHPVTLHVQEVSLNEALRQVFEGQPLAYEIADGAVTVWGKDVPGLPDKPGSNIIGGMADNEIRGRVVDSLGKGLPSVTVRVKGAEIATKTDQSGYFILNKVPADAVIEITSLGYKPYTVQANKLPDPVVFVLSLATSTLDETVIIAYGTTSRRLNTGNVATITSKDIERQPVTNPLAALQGRIPGMLVTQTSGIPGAAFNVQIRGRTAIDQNLTSDEPLFVIDGVPFGQGNKSMYNRIPIAGASQNMAAVQAGISPFNGINPLDIESITVLKDADATAIYGSRGANGVVLITTKKAKEGSFSVSLSSNHGIAYIAELPQMMNTQQYVAARKQAFANDGIAMTNANAYDLLLWDTTRNYNYAKMLAGGVATNHNTQLTLSGGSKLTKFSLRGGYNWQNTVLSKAHRDKRTNLNFNISQSSRNEKFLLNFSGNYTDGANNLTSEDLSNSLTLRPHLRLYNADGSLSWEEGGYKFTNPLASFNRQTSSRAQTIYASLQPVYHITKYLTLSANLGYNTASNSQRYITPMSAMNPGLSSSIRQVSIGTTGSESWSVEPQAEYKTKIGGGTVQVLLGGTLQRIKAASQTTMASNFPSDESMRSISNAPTFTMYEGFSDYKYAAFFGRVNYNWRNTYLINLTARRDGSSRFGPGRHFANFGAAGGGWIFTNLRGIADALPWLSFGKIRASYGITGNDKIKDYQFLDTWAVLPSQKPELGMAFLYPDKLFNPGYQWESTVKTEYALELGLFEDRIQVSPAYFRNRSSNQLVNYKLPYTTGFTGVVANLPATVVNAGVEITLRSDNIKRNNFSWSTSLNLSIPKNKLKAFPGIENSSYYTTYKVGKPLNQIYKLKYLGVNPDNGDITFEDLDGDRRSTTADYQYLGSTDPKYYGGIQNSFSYKNFNLDFFILFRKTIGQNYTRFYFSGYGFGNNNINLPAIVSKKVWEKRGDIAGLPRLSTVIPSDYYDFALSSDGIYSDASYIRLNNASLSYSLPGTLLNRWHIAALRVYALAQNLFTITNYEVGDPETQTFLATPPLRTITMGLQLTL